MGATGELKIYLEKRSETCFSPDELKKRVMNWRNHWNNYSQILAVIIFAIGTLSGLPNSPSLKLGLFFLSCSLWVGLFTILLLNLLLSQAEQFGKACITLYQIFDLVRSVWFITFYVGLAFFTYTLLISKLC